MNFLKETLQSLEKFNKTEQDVISVGNNKYRVSWDTFKKNANFEYDNGFGGQEICPDLKIYGKTFVMFRCEYDGSEWWDIINIPQDITPNINNITIDFRKYEPDNYEDIIGEGVNEDWFSALIEQR